MLRIEDDLFSCLWIYIWLLILTRLWSSDPLRFFISRLDLYSSLHHNAVPQPPLLSSSHHHHSSPLRLSSFHPSVLPSFPVCWIQGCLETPLPLSPEGANGERMLAYGGALAESWSFLISFEHDAVGVCVREKMCVFCRHTCVFFLLLIDPRLSPAVPLSPGLASFPLTPLKCFMLWFFFFFCLLAFIWIINRASGVFLDTDLVPRTGEEQGWNVCSFFSAQLSSILQDLTSLYLSLVMFFYSFSLCRCVPPALAPLASLVLTHVPVCVSKQPRDLKFSSRPSVPFVLCFVSFLSCFGAVMYIWATRVSAALTRNRHLLQIQFSDPLGLLSHQIFMTNRSITRILSGSRVNR